MENVIVVIYEDEKTAYQVLSDLKNRSGNSAVLQAGIIQNVGGSIVVKDGWSSVGNTDSWASGGLIGGLIGILGGPVGMLLGASIGMLVGGTIDATDTVANAGVVEQAAHEMSDGKLGLIVIADEADISELDAFFSHYGSNNIIRHDVASVQAEIYQAEETARELKKQARANMRKEKKEEWPHKAKGVQDEVRKDFDDLRQKIKP